MVTFTYEWKILEWDDKLQNKQAKTNKSLLDIFGHIHLPNQKVMFLSYFRENKLILLIKSTSWSVPTIKIFCKFQKYLQTTTNIQFLSFETDLEHFIIPSIMIK